MGSTSVASVAASGVVCDSSLFSLEIAVSKKLLTSDGARTKSSVSLIKQVAFVGQQREAFGLQGRVVDVAHVGQAHPCYKSRTAEYPHGGRGKVAGISHTTFSNAFSSMKSFNFD